jgi:ribosomal protein S18 acetylase RimI-like enzyme
MPLTFTKDQDYKLLKAFQQIKIESVHHSQIKELQNISEQTFKESFAEQNTKEDMSKYLAEYLNEAKIMEEMKNSNSEFYFAKIEDELVGYLKLNFATAQTVFLNADWIEIERIYVFKKYHGKEVGQNLLEQALHVAKNRNAKCLWLGVWEKNPRAIRFYNKNGFIEFDKHMFLLGNDEQTDIMMKLEL